LCISRKSNEVTGHKQPQDADGDLFVDYSYTGKPQTCKLNHITNKSKSIQFVRCSGAYSKQIARFVLMLKKSTGAAPNSRCFYIEDK
jgi:hypothetical protein